MTFNISNFQEDDLAALIASKYDEAGHHTLWVSNEGDIWLEVIPDSLSPAGYATLRKEDMKLRFETFHSGNGYIGKEASKDVSFVNRLHRAMMTHWQSGESEYIDIY